MDIDLLITPQGQAGLLSNKNLVKKAVGIIFDTDSGVLSLEFADMDHLNLNIPVEEEFFTILDNSPQIHIGSVHEGRIAQAYQVPLMFLDDPYRAEAFENVALPEKPLAAFYYFVKNCVLGQPVHRLDAGNEDSLGCILGNRVPASLEFARHLARRHGMEIGHEKAVKQPNTLSMGLGINSSSGAYSSSGRTYYQKKYTRKSDDDDKGKGGS